MKRTRKRDRVKGDVMLHLLDIAEGLEDSASMKELGLINWDELMVRYAKRIRTCVAELHLAGVASGNSARCGTGFAEQRKPLDAVAGREADISQGLARPGGETGDAT